MTERRIAFVTLLTSLTLLPSCIGVPGPEARVVPMVEADAAASLGCTPLQMTIAGADEKNNAVLSLGSGVLVHPRVIATVDHVVPYGATHATCFRGDRYAGEAVAIRRVVRGTRSGLWDGDWALIVLDAPFMQLDPHPVSRMLGPDEAPPAPGTPVRIAGFPSADGATSLTERDALVVDTRISRRPREVPPTDMLIFAGRDTHERSLRGASGGPALIDPGDGGPPVLVGLYAGSAGVEVLGVELSSTIVLQRVPAEAIERVIDELEAE